MRQESERGRTFPRLGSVSRAPARGGPGASQPAGRAEGPREMLGIRAQAFVAIVVALLGFLVVAQFQRPEALGDRLAIEREADLVRLLSDLSSRSDRLLEETIELRLRLAETAGSEERTAVLIRNAEDELEALRIILGTAPVVGPGIHLRILDPERSVGPDVLLDTVQEMRDAGAEALEINGHRVVAQSAFSGAPGAVRLAGRLLAPPYLIKAIASPETIAEAMRIPGGVVALIGTRAGATASIEQLDEVRIDSLHELVGFTYAQPIQRR